MRDEKEDKDTDVCEITILYYNRNPDGKFREMLIQND